MYCNIIGKVKEHCTIPKLISRLGVKNLQGFWLIMMKLRDNLFRHLILQKLSINQPYVPAARIISNLLNSVINLLKKDDKNDLEYMKLRFYKENKDEYKI